MGLKNIFENIGTDEFRQKIDECDGYQKILKLRIHGDSDVQRLVNSLLPYFDVKPPPRSSINFGRLTT